MWLLIGVAAGVIVLAHTAPAPFLLDVLAGRRAIWHMPRTSPPSIYLTYDDGPNPTTTPDLLTVLAAGGVHATFFLIDRHITERTLPIVRRMFADGHCVALHSHSRSYMFMRPETLAATLITAAERIERLTGSRPCRAFRPHAGWRSYAMYAGLARIGFSMIGWGWMLWDWNWFRRRTADAVIHRVARRSRAGDIVVMHDGDESAPEADQRHTVEATARLIPALRAKGFQFRTVCDNAGVM